MADYVGRKPLGAAHCSEIALVVSDGVVKLRGVQGRGPFAVVFNRRRACSGDALGISVWTNRMIQVLGLKSNSWPWMVSHSVAK